jgi:hypothetical protein
MPFSKREGKRTTSRIVIQAYQVAFKPEILCLTHTLETGLHTFKILGTSHSVNDFLNFLSTPINAACFRNERTYDRLTC